MKDYYYFLGVNKDDSAEEIRKAYRKICFKCHPDKTENDPFFQRRFRELQEAYETLSDPDRRMTYDHLLTLEKKDSRSSLPPKIKSFHANKIRIQKGEEIIISWKTYDADVVKIHPFGLVKARGEKTITIPEFDEEGKFQIIINATNTYLNQTVADGITICEQRETPRVKMPVDIHGRSADFSNNKKRKYHKEWVFAAVAVLLLAVYFIISHF